MCVCLMHHGARVETTRVAAAASRIKEDIGVTVSVKVVSEEPLKTMYLFWTFSSISMEAIHISHTKRDQLCIRVEIRLALVQLL